MKAKVIDNFLDESYFNHISDIICGDRFNWHANEYSDNKDDPKDNNIQFTHVFMYQGYVAQSSELIRDMLIKINPLAVNRVKANLIVRTEKPVKQNFHIDIQESKKYQSGILYLNTNNGYTLFEDGTKVECVANRFLRFPGPMRHCAVTQTATPFRVVINANWVDF